MEHEFTTGVSCAETQSIAADVYRPTEYNYQIIETLNAECDVQNAQMTYSNIFEPGDAVIFVYTVMLPPDPNLDEVMSEVSILGAGSYPILPSELEEDHPSTIDEETPEE
jgi:hypothetical protein